MNDEMRFFMYLTECYAAYKGKKSGEVLREWEQHNIIEKIYDNYWLYHTERLENAYADIDSLIASGEYAW